MVRNSMMAHTAALLLLALLFCSWSHVGAEAEDCCLTTVNKRIPHRLVKTFYIQTRDMGCRIPATVFVTRRDIKLCAPLASQSSWVKKLIRGLNNQAKRKSKGKKQ